MWISTDGFVWSRVPHDEAVFGGPGNQQMLAIAGTGSGLIVVGSDNGRDFFDAAVWSSPDGSTWSRVPHDEGVLGGPGNQVMTSVTSTDLGLVAVGTDSSGGDADAAVWTSPDGLMWSRVPHSEAVFGGRGYQGMSAVAAAGSGYIAVGGGIPVTVDLGYAAMVWTSPVGVAWSRVPHDETVFGGQDHQVVAGVVATASGVIAVGYDWSGGDPDAAVWRTSEP